MALAKKKQRPFNLGSKMNRIIAAWRPEDPYPKDLARRLIPRLMGDQDLVGAYQMYFSVEKEIVPQGAIEAGATQEEWDEWRKEALEWMTPRLNKMMAKYEEYVRSAEYIYASVAGCPPPPPSPRGDHPLPRDLFKAFDALQRWYQEAERIAPGRPPMSEKAMEAAAFIDDEFDRRGRVHTLEEVAEAVGQEASSFRGRTWKELREQHGYINGRDIGRGKGCYPPGHEAS